MNLIYIKKLNTTELFVDADSLEFVVKREYSADSLSLLQKLKKLETQIKIPHNLKLEINGDKITTYEQYIEGQTFQQLIDNGQFITKHQLDSYIEQLVIMLQILHQNDIIHKDIKPDNIVINDDIVYLIDFNISRMYKQMQSKDTQLFGTEGYASPEQYGFSQTTRKSDVYSLGKTIEQLLKITITTPNEYDQYSTIISQMTCLDPRMRIDLEQIAQVPTETKTKQVFTKVMSVSKPFPGIIQTSGNLLAKLLATYLFLAYTYEMFISELGPVDSKGMYIGVIVTYYIGAYAVNIWIVPFTNEWYQKLKATNIVFRIGWGLFIVTIELLCFSLIIALIINIIKFFSYV